MAFADDYVDVAERVRAFYEKYPDGSLQSEIVELSDTRVTVKAYAYRDRMDDKPAIGHSSLTIPGKTNFTRDSEIENAETSAWGRALAGLGFATKHIASQQEVANKQPAARLPRPPAPAEHTCPIHKVAMQQSTRTGTWGHMVNGAPCVGEAAKQEVAS